MKSRLLLKGKKIFLEIESDPWSIECPECKDHGESEMFCTSCNKWMDAPVCLECQAYWTRYTKEGENPEAVDTMVICPLCRNYFRTLKVKIVGEVEVEVDEAKKLVCLSLKGGVLKGTLRQVGEELILRYKAGTLPDGVKKQFFLMYYHHALQQWCKFDESRFHL